MAEWIRPLYHEAGASARWHIARDKGTTSTMFCGQTIRGPLEVARHDEQTDPDGRCEDCPHAFAQWRERSVMGSGRR